MEIKIDRGGPTVEINIGYSTYLLDRENYNALFHAMLQEPADDVVWVSCVTADMVADPEDSGNLIDDLDDYVAQTVMEYGSEDDK